MSLSNAYTDHDRVPERRMRRLSPPLVTFRAIRSCNSADLGLVGEVRGQMPTRVSGKSKTNSPGSMNGLPRINVVD